MSLPGPIRLLSRGSWPETARIADVLRKETVGGTLLLIAAVVALVWANSPWSAGYFALGDVQVGPQALHLRLTLGAWAADGLLAIFFFVAGLELKREFVAGDLRHPARAAVPVAAAVGGVLVPALLYAAVNLAGAGDLAGWAIPTATDIAFALAVLAIIGSHLPSALRTFLLTLAVVDDLLAITIIAVFYTKDLQVGPLLLALIPLALFAVAVQCRIRSWWLLLPLAAATWTLVHASGVHATVAGILLGFAVPVVRRAAGAGPGLAEHFEHRWRPLSASVAVPVFAFFAPGGNAGRRYRAGQRAARPRRGRCSGRAHRRQTRRRPGRHVARCPLHPRRAGHRPVVVGRAGPGHAGRRRVHRVAAHRRARLGAGTDRDNHVKVAILAGSVTAAALAAILLHARSNLYQRLSAAETADTDQDGTPDAYESDQ